MTQALALGINRRTLYRLRDEGQIERVTRGVFRLSSLPPLSNPDLVTVVLRVPKAVVCLVSALAHHGVTSFIRPRLVSLGLSLNRTPVGIAGGGLVVSAFVDDRASGCLPCDPVPSCDGRCHSPASRWSWLPPRPCTARGRLARRWSRTATFADSGLFPLSVC